MKLAEVKPPQHTAPGDSIEVKLKIYQVRDEDVGIFTNAKCEVIEALTTIKGTQRALIYKQILENMVRTKSGISQYSC